MSNKHNNRRSLRTIFSKIIIGIASISLATTTISASTDFSGKRIEWIVPFKEGGGSDTWARFYAPYISEHLPGKPVIVVKNIPGGGSTKGANQFQRRAKPNGLTVLGTSGSTQFPYLLDDKRVKYDYNDWLPVLASPTNGVFYVSSDLGVNTAKDLTKLRGQSLKYASQGATSLDLVPLLALDMLEIDVQAIFGMKGRGAGRLAFERGEVNIDYQTSSAYLKKVAPLVEEGKAIPIMTWGVLGDDGKIKRDPTFPDLPHFVEVYEFLHGEQPNGTKFNVWKSFFISGFAAQKGIFLPKGTPETVIRSWREAVANAIETEKFKLNAEKVLGHYPQAVQEEAVTAFQTALSISESDKQWVRDWLSEKYNVRF